MFLFIIDSHHKLKIVNDYMCYIMDVRSMFHRLENIKIALILNINQSSLVSFFYLQYNFDILLAMESHEIQWQFFKSIRENVKFI